MMGEWRIWRTETEGGRSRDGKRRHAEDLKGLTYEVMRRPSWEVMQGTNEKR